MTASVAGSALHVFLTAAQYESRFIKQARASLRAGEADRVILAAREAAGLPMTDEIAPGVLVQRVPLRSAGLPKSLPFQLLKGLEYRARVVGIARHERPAVVVAHSLPALAPALAAARAVRAPVLYDAHELETERNGLRGARQMFDRALEAKLIRQCAAVTVVSDSIADWYASRYRIARPTVVRNVPDIGGQSAAQTAAPLRQLLGLGPDAILHLYVGGLFRGRRVEQFIRVFEGLSSPHHLVFLGYGELDAEVQAAAKRSAHIHAVPAVAPDQVLGVVRDADVGLVGVEDVCLSYRYSLPNKLFEYLAAGVPVLAPRYPEIANFLGTSEGARLVGETDDDWRKAVLQSPAGWKALASAEVAALARAVRWEDEARKFVDVHRRVRLDGRVS